MILTMSSLSIYKSCPRLTWLIRKMCHAFVYVCTIQRMMVNLFGRYALLASDAANEEPLDGDADLLDIPTHAY